MVIRKIRIYGLKQDAEKIIYKLGLKGIIHIENFENEKLTKNEEYVKITSNLLNKIESISKEKIKITKKDAEKFKFNDFKKKLEEITNKLDAIILKKKNYREIEREIEYYRKILNLIKNMPDEYNLTKIVEKYKFVYLLKISKKEIGKIANLECKKEIFEINDLDFLVLLGCNEKIDLNQTTIEIPKFIGNVKEAIDELKKKINDLILEKNKLKKEKIDDKLIKLYKDIKIAHKIAEGIAKLGFTKYMFILQGYILEKNIDELNKIKNIEFEFLNENIENIPAKIPENKTLKSFYAIESLVGPPSNKIINPLYTIIIHFPLFFGMMVGDIGYGILLLLISTLFAKQTNKLFKNLLGKEFENFSIVLLYSAIYTIFFGFIFGEFFGDLGKFLGLKPIIDRLRDMKILLITTIFLGILHINLALTLAILSELKNRSYKKAFGKFTWILLEISSLFFVYNKNIAVILSILSILLMIKFEGLVEILEIPNFIGNIFSYLRIAAIGLSSVGIAIIINRTFLKLANKHIILALLILIFGHLLNFILVILDPFIQATRLHLVEFFSKFYETAERTFIPYKIYEVI